MNKLWECVFDVVIGILTIFISVSVFFGLRTESVINSMYESITEEFVINVKRNGILTLEDYEKYMDRMGTGSSLFNISFEHGYKIYEPEYRFRTLEEIITEQNKAYTGSNDYHYREVVTARPHVDDPVNDGNLNTETNESILSNAINTPADPNHIHDEGCYIGHKHSTSFTDEKGNLLNCYAPELRVVYGYEYENSIWLCNKYSIYCNKCMVLLYAFSVTDYGTYSTIRGYNYNVNQNATIYFPSFSFNSSDPQSSTISSQLYDLLELTEGYAAEASVSIGSLWISIPAGYIIPAGKTLSVPYWGVFGGCTSCDSDIRIMQFQDESIYESNYEFNIYTLRGNKRIALIRKNHIFLYPYNSGSPVYIQAADIPQYNLFWNRLLEIRSMTKLEKDWYYRIDPFIHSNNKNKFAVNIDYDADLLMYDFIKDYITLYADDENYGDFTYCNYKNVLACNKIIKNISPTHPEQTVYINDPLITTAVVTYKDGSAETVLCTTDFLTSSIVSNEEVTLKYENSITCKIKVNVIPRNKTCTKGHTYNLNIDGSDPECPYCREWIESLCVIYPDSSPLVIIIGTTLQDNNVKLLATYMDEHTEEVSSGYIDNLDTGYLGTKPVTIGYKGASVTVMVTTVCAVMICDICGHEYKLYPDGTNPGCPYCIQKIPVFTGNIMVYEHINHTEELLDILYEKKQYLFNIDDFFGVKISSKTSTIASKFLRKIYPALSETWIVIEKKEHVMSK